MDLKQFKEDLRGKIADFAISGHLINISRNRKSNEKETEIEEMYQRLETWILQQFYPMIENPIVKKDPLDTTANLDF